MRNLALITFVMIQCFSLNSLAAAPAASTLSLEIKGDINMIDPKQANDRAQLSFNPAPTDYARPSNFGTGLGYDAALFYHVDINLAFGAFMSHISDDTSGSGSLGGTGVTSDFTVGGNVYGLEARYALAKILDTVDLVGLAQLGLGNYYYKEKASNNALLEASAKGLHFAIGGIMQYHFNPSFDFLGGMGYRISKSNDVKVSKTEGNLYANGDTLPTITGSNTQVDLSGLFINLGVAYNF